MNPTPREPFDAEEAAVARAIRADAGGEPSPQLDARILAHARAAVAARPRRARPWFLGAGVGAAAAAVMAAGIAWQIGWRERADDGIGTPAAQRSAVGERARRQPEAGADVERIEIDYIKEERKAVEQSMSDAPTVAAPPPPPPPPPPAAAPAMRPPAAPPEPPAPEASTVLADEAMAPRSEPAPQPFPAEAEADAAAELGAVAGSSRDDRGNAAATAAQAAPGRAASGAGLAKQRAALPPWPGDAALASGPWLERIRERVREGDRQGAKHSLRQFVLDHPRVPVPPELQRLLVE